MVAATLSLAGASRLAAEQPDHRDLSNRLFLMRATVAQNTSYHAEPQGIWSYDVVSKQFELFASFVYLVDTSVGRVQLAALEDRLVLQGSAYWEFDLASGRLLRSYQGMQDEFRSWAFQGAMISESVGARLGIEPGTYGFPICPPSSGFTGIGCNPPSIPFPGYSFPVGTETRFDLLLHRGLRPEQTTLKLVKVFANVSDGWIFSDRRFLAVDERRHGFWYWTNRSRNNTDFKQQLSFAPIAGSSLADETVVREMTSGLTSPAEQRRHNRQFTYLPAADSFFHLFSYINSEGSDHRLIRQSSDLTTEELIDRTVHQDYFLGKPSTGSMTAVPETLPEQWVQVVPAVGYGAGANGTQWRSDVYLYNPSDAAMAVSIRRVARPERTVDFSLAARSSLTLDNVLKQMGGGPLVESGDGVSTDALVVTSSYRWGQQLSVYSRTYTPSTADGQAGGTYGQAVPAVPSHVGYSTETGGSDTISTPSVLILDKRDPSQYRHNLGAVNDSSEPLTIRLRYAVLSTNPPINPDLNKSVVVNPHSVANVNIESLFSPHILAERPPRILISTDRPAPIWLSMVDNQTGDATFVPFSLHGIRTDANTRAAIPAVANAPGANGTFWRTDLYGFFPIVEKGESNQTPRSWFYPANGVSCSAAQIRLSGEVGAPVLWDQYWHNVFPDIASQFPDCADGMSVRGALELRLGSWMSGFARTFTRRSDGGTFGEMLPFYPPRGWPVQHFSGIGVNTRFRVNVGLYNGLERAVLNRLQLYDAKGVLVGEKKVLLTPKESLQEPLAFFFGTELSAGFYGLSVIPEDVKDSPGRSWAYVSTIDNVTGDPTNWW